MVGVLGELDARAVRRWCAVGLRNLGRARQEIDALNVFPVPDGDTGTNLFLTLESAADAVEATFAGRAPGDAQPPLADVLHALAQGALMGARGNSGVILGQVLRAVADQFTDELAGAADGADGADLRAGAGPVLRRALRRASDAAYAAVARPVEGTMLTVARAAADAAESAADGVAPVVRAAARAAAEALARTPDQLPDLREAGVVDAGGRGLCVLLDALVAVATGEDRDLSWQIAHARPHRAPERPAPGRPAPAFEVVYLLDAPQDALPGLRAELDALGDSLVIGGGDGLWSVHVHVDDAGAAVEAGLAAGRPHRIRITHLADATPRARHARAGVRAIVAVSHGDGLAALFQEAGAHVVEGGPGRRPSTAALVAAVRGTGAAEVVLLPNDADCHAVAQVAAEQVAADGIHVQTIPTKAAVQGLAALAVHDPGRRFDQDVVGMTAAAGATRYGALTIAAREAWTMAGVCQAGDVLGIIEDDIAVIGTDLATTAETVLDRMVAGGGELVTLVTGRGLPAGLVDSLLRHVRASRPEVDIEVHDGGQTLYPLLVGVE